MVTSLQGANILADSLQKQFNDSKRTFSSNAIEKINDLIKEERSLLSSVLADNTLNTLKDESSIRVIKKGKKTYHMPVVTYPVWGKYAGLQFIGNESRHFQCHTLEYQELVKRQVADNNDHLLACESLVIRLISNIRWDKSLWGQLDSNYVTRLRRAINKMSLEGIMQLISENGTPVVTIE